MCLSCCKPSPGCSPNRPRSVSDDWWGWTARCVTHLLGHVSPQDYQVAVGSRGCRSFIDRDRYLHCPPALRLRSVAWRSGNPPARMGASQTMARQVAAIREAPRSVGSNNRPLIRYLPDADGATRTHRSTTRSQPEAWITARKVTKSNCLSAKYMLKSNPT